MQHSQTTPRLSSQMLLILLICLACLRGVLYGLITPVNQAPDELHHFIFIKAKQLALNGVATEKRTEIARQFEHAIYFLQYPEAERIPTSEELGENNGIFDESPSGDLYYTVNGWLLKLFSFKDFRDEFYFIRAVSVLGGVLVVGMAYLSAKALFPDNQFMIIGVPVLITFIPQFSAMSGTINNDKFTEVLVACTLLIVIHIFKRGLSISNIILLTVVFGLTILGKRTALFMIPVIFIVFFVYWWKWKIGLGMHAVLLAILAAFAVSVYLLLWRFYGLNELIAEHLIWAPVYRIKDFLFSSRVYSVASLKQYAKFFIVLYWSFWGTFGYMTIHLHQLWYVLIACVQSLSVVGVAWFVVQAKRQRIRIERWQSKTLYLFGVSILFAILVPFLRSNVFRFELVLAQGRYLFPVLIPISVLTVFGLSVIFPPNYHKIVGIMGIVGLIILDSVCLFHYLLLNFHGAALL